MPWARFDERYPTHRKVRRLSDAAFRLDVSAVCFANENLTDGHIGPDDLDLVSDVRKPAAAAAELVTHGRWHRPGHDCKSEHCRPIDDGWLIHDYLEYNPARAKVIADRDAAKERQRKARDAARAKREQQANSREDFA